MLRFLVLTAALVLSTSVSISAHAAVYCSPGSVSQAHAQYDQGIAAAQAELQTGYDQAQATLQSNTQLAESHRTIALGLPKVDPDHSAERMNEIQAQYLREMDAAQATYQQDVTTAQGQFDVEVTRLTAAYNTATCQGN